MILPIPSCLRQNRVVSLFLISQVFLCCFAKQMNDYKPEHNPKQTARYQRPISSANFKATEWNTVKPSAPENA